MSWSAASPTLRSVENIAAEQLDELRSQCPIRVVDGRGVEPTFTIWGHNAQAAVTENEIVVAAQVTTPARDSVVFASMVCCCRREPLDTTADRIATFVADTGYWTIPNATLDIDADVLFTPMPMTQGITDPNDPRLASGDLL